MKLSFLTLLTAGLYQATTASHDQVRALAKKRVQQVHRLLIDSDDDDGFLDDDDDFLDDLDLTDGARECSAATDTLHENNPSFEDCDAIGDDENFDSCSDGENFECILDQSSAFNCVDPLCMAANGRTMSLDLSLSCEANVEGESRSRTFGVIDAPFCVDTSCSSQELQEIMTAVADHTLEEINTEFDDNDAIDLRCTSSIKIKDPDNGKTIFNGEKEPGDDRSFLEIAQSQGTSGTGKLAASGLVVTAALVAAIV